MDDTPSASAAYIPGSPTGVPLESFDFKAHPTEISSLTVIWNSLLLAPPIDIKTLDLANVHAICVCVCVYVCMYVCTMPADISGGADNAR